MDDQEYEAVQIAREAASADESGRWVAVANPSVGSVLNAFRGPYWTTPMSGDALTITTAKRQNAFPQRHGLDLVWACCLSSPICQHRSTDSVH